MENNDITKGCTASNTNRNSDLQIGADSHPSLVLVYGRKLVQLTLDSLEGKQSGLPLCHRHVVNSPDQCLVCQLVNDIKLELARREASPDDFP